MAHILCSNFYEIIGNTNSSLVMEAAWESGQRGAGRGTLESSSTVHRYTLLSKSVQTHSSDMGGFSYVRWTSIKTLVLKMPWTKVSDFTGRMESCGVGKSFRHAISVVSQWVTTHCAASLLSVKGQGAKIKRQLWLSNPSWKKKNWYNFLSIWSLETRLPQTKN